MKFQIVWQGIVWLSLGFCCASAGQSPQPRELNPQELEPNSSGLHREVPDDAPAKPAGVRETSPGGLSIRGPFVSVQVNVNENGQNIVGDAANEPSLAVDPLRGERMAIGWRQFDSVSSNFRQAGVAFTQDAGATWTFPGVLTPGTFRSDPVLKSNAEGDFYYYSLTIINDTYVCDMFKSTDGGVTWSGPVPARGGDKQWMTVDRTAGIGKGHIYAEWSPFYSCCAGFFTRSTNQGMTYSTPTNLPLALYWGTNSVGPNGDLFVSGMVNNSTPGMVRSSNAQNSGQTPTFPLSRNVNLGGSISFGAGPNPAGLLGQVWIGTDHSNRATHDNVYMLATLNPAGEDPSDVMFSRSTDGGSTWSSPIRLNSDAAGSGRYQWFGTLSVSPSGRIDVIWNDNRNFAPASTSEVYYTYSCDGGTSWSINTPISQPFNPHVGYPNQNKLGDYYDLESDLDGSNLAYAATHNGEQDVYYLRLNTARLLSSASYRLARGRPGGGNLDSLLASDDQHLKVLQPLPRTLVPGKTVSIDFDSGGFDEIPWDLNFKLESHVEEATQTAAFRQTVQWFDFQQNAFVTVWTGTPDSTDRLLTAFASGNPERFVDPSSGKFKARVTWTLTSAQALPFSVWVDRIEWAATPR